MLDLEIPLIINRLIERVGERKEVGRRKPWNSRGDGVKAPAGMELRKKRLIGLRGGSE